MKSRILELLGGEALRESSPLSYAALSDISPIPVKSLSTGDSARDIYAGADELFLLKEDAGVGILQRGCFAGKIPFMATVSELYDRETGLLLDTFNEYWENFYYCESKLKATSRRVQLAAKKPMRLVSTYVWSHDGMSVHERTIEFLVDQYIGGTPIITELNVTAPRARDHRLTSVLYDRAGDADYCYKNVTLPDNKAKVMMPFAGSLKADDNFKIMGIMTGVSGEEPEMRLMLENGGTVSYGYDMKHFTEQFTISPDKSTLTWDFSPDWNAVLDLRHFAGVTIVDFACAFTLNLKNKATPAVMHPRVMITSTREKEPRESGSIEIEPIQIRWGCIAAGTPVKMDDGSEKKIEEIRPGDRVLTTDGGTAKVRDVVTGREDLLFRLKTQSGHSLLMTGSHPVKTGRGWVRADALTAADVITTEAGDSHVCELYSEENPTIVYNLALEPSAAIYCGGIAAGDYAMQNGMEAAVEIDPPPTPLQLELRRLFGKTPAS